MKKALITGITGQDGSYLAELLCEKGYQVFGMVRRASSPNTSRINYLIDSSFGKNVELLDGDLTDTSSIYRCLKEVEPDEVYNLGAQSHVGVSFASPEYTADVDALGTLRILEGIRCLNMKCKTKFYQASTSELYGLVQEIPQKESTPFYPRSPYAVAKLYSYWITVNYREAYGMFACNGILFNHESPRRGETFVTRKITKSISEIALGKRKFVALGNLSSLRDWGHAQDYVLMQWMMLQQSIPKDYVIATGEQYSVRDFLTWSAAVLGISIKFQGSGENEVGVVTSIEGDKAPGVNIGQVIAKVDKEFFRPAEVDTLLGDPALAKADLNWCPKITVREMCEEMVLSDYRSLLKR